MTCVGETGRALKVRIAENRKAFTIGDCKASALTEHLGVHVTLSCLTKGVFTLNSYECALQS